MSDNKVESVASEELVRIAKTVVVKDNRELMTAVTNNGLVQPGVDETIEEYLERLNERRHDVFPIRSAICSAFSVDIEQFNIYYRQMFPNSIHIPSKQN